jgi:PhnB protein
MASLEKIPEQYRGVIPYLNIKLAGEAVEFYKRAFGAEEVGRITLSDGTIAHCEMKIGQARFMIAEETQIWGNKSPGTLGGTPVSFCIYVDNVDEVFKRALDEGATALNNMEVQDHLYGDRAGTLIDPFGHQWSVMTHVEDVTFEEMQKRSDIMFTGF